MKRKVIKFEKMNYDDILEDQYQELTSRKLVIYTLKFQQGREIRLRSLQEVLVPSVAN